MFSGVFGARRRASMSSDNNGATFSRQVHIQSGGVFARGIHHRNEHNPNLRYQWQRAETHVFSRLRRGFHPMMLQESAQQSRIECAGDMGRVEYYTSVVRIISNLQNGGHFDGLPSRNAFERRSTRARHGVMMRNRYSDTEALARHAMDDEIARRIAASRALDREAENELRILREREWKDVEEQFRANEAALRAQIAVLEEDRQKNAAQSLRGLDDHKSTISRAPTHQSTKSRAPSDGGPSIYGSQSRAGNAPSMPAGYYGAQMANGVERPYEANRLIGDGPDDMRSQPTHRSNMARSSSRGEDRCHTSREVDRHQDRARSNPQSHSFNMRDVSENLPRHRRQSDAGNSSRTEVPRPENRHTQRRDQGPPVSMRGFFDPRLQPTHRARSNSVSSRAPTTSSYGTTENIYRGESQIYSGQSGNGRMGSDYDRSTYRRGSVRLDEPTYSRNGYEVEEPLTPPRDRRRYPVGYAETINSSRR